MPTVIRRLAGWAHALSSADLPASVRERARLQQIHLAGAIRAVAGRPLAAALPAGDDAAERAQRWAALGGWLEADDVLLGGRTGVGAVAAAWAGLDSGSAQRELDLAVVAGNEVGGRVGLAGLLGPGLLGYDPAPTAVAAAVAAGRMRGLSAEQLAHAIAHAVAAAGAVVPPAVLARGGGAAALRVGQAAQLGVTAAQLAASGAQGDLELLDDPDLLQRRAWLPLPVAFTGLGQAWLTETLAFKLTPGPLAAQVAVQSVHEVLRRHIKAADKRLRADQIERIEVRTGALGCALAGLEAAPRDPAAVVRDLRRLTGVLVVGHELGLSQLEAGWLAENGEAADALADRIEVTHDAARSLRLLEQLATVAAPLLAEVSREEAGRLALRLRGALGVPWGSAGLRALLRARPDRLAGRLRQSRPDLAEARLDEWQFRFDTEVKVFTTRGGSWPERRTIPEGSPGWSWEQTIAGSCARLPGETGRHLLGARPSDEGKVWMGILAGESVG